MIDTHEDMNDPNEFKQTLDKLGLNPTSAARFFGVSRQQIYKLQNGQPVPSMMKLLINILLSMTDEDRKEWMGVNE